MNMISSNLAVESAQLSRPSRSRDSLAPGTAVLVTGGTGYTGGSLVSALTTAGHRVRVLARPSSDLSRLPPGVEVVCADLKDHHAHRIAVDGIEIVFHIAAAFREARLSVREYEAINVEASEALADAAARASVARFVHCSTGGVHGHVEFPPANEDAPLNAGDWYQETKLRGELRVREVAARTGLALTVARPTGIYGPGDRRLLKLFRSVARGQFLMFGSGRVHYHLTYIDDLVDGLIRCAASPGAVGGVYLLGGAESLPLRTLVARIAEACGTSPPRRHWPLSPVRVAATMCERVWPVFGLEPPLHHRRVDLFVKNRCFDISRAQRELNYAPKVSVDEGIGRTLRWYRENGWM